MAEKFSSLWILLALIFAAVLLMFFFPVARDQDNDKVCFQKDCFRVDIADSPEEQSRGLMYVEYLAPDSGMLFVFPREDYHGFWMKNTLIPLDMVWMDSNKTVVFIKKDAQPCATAECPTINPGVQARYVLELNAGTVERIGLLVGGKAVFEIA